MKLFPDSDSKKNTINAIKMLVFVGAAFLLIATLGSSVKTPGWAIPVGTLSMGALTWFGSAGKPKKFRLKLTVGWTALVAIFTTVGVLVS